MIWRRSGWLTIGSYRTSRAHKCPVIQLLCVDDSSDTPAQTKRSSAGQKTLRETRGRIRIRGQARKERTVHGASRPTRETQLKTTDLNRARGSWRRNVPGLLNISSVLWSCLSWCPVIPTVGSEPSNEEILVRVADSSLKARAASYSGIREYTLRSIRFDKKATVSAEVAYRPPTGKTYTVLERSGSARLAEIVGKLLAWEADASKPTKVADHEISPANYQAGVRGTETAAGRTCYVVDLTPKHKSKCLIKGTIWVDRKTYGVVRIEGSPSASVSIWAGTPHIQQEFSEINGVWLPVHTQATSSGLFLGTSELDVRYKDYHVADVHCPNQERAAEAVPKPQP